MVSTMATSEYPYWSAVSFLFPIVLLLLVRKVVRANSYYHVINECLCTVLWLLWCFEIHAVTIHSNYTVHLLVLFVALVLQSIVYQEAVVNPAVLIVKSLQSNWPLKRTLSLLAAQLLAIPITMVTIVVVWKVLSIISHPHEHMSIFIPQDFLNVNAFEGFCIEALATFILSLSSLLVSKGVLLHVVSSINYLSMEYVFGSFSGAFCNPLSATIFCIFYQKHALVEICIVYWCGSITGALMAWKLFFDKPTLTTT